MFDIIIAWVAKHPKLHIFCLTLMFFGLVVGWIFIMLPFAIYDAWCKDFGPYFAGIKEIWKTRNKRS